jgi:putative SbcD/Mre11-related phosphoesterase
MYKEFSRHELLPGVWLDGRRALWLAEEQVLAVADLHLGYLWAQRRAGLLLPLSAPDDAIDRLIALQQCYQPRQCLVLGDIVHRAVELPAVVSELQRLVCSLGPNCQLRLVVGNHDRNLAELLAKLELNCALEEHVQIGHHRLFHGDDPEANGNLKRGRAAGGLTIIGHEHPAVWVGDGVTTSAKCPCFLVGPRVLILPAFSQWAAGVSVTSGQFMGSIARGERFRTAVAILNERLLPIALSRRKTN